MQRWHHLEQEVKLDVDADWSLPDLTGVMPGTEVRVLPSLLLETTYYDTVDRRLERLRIALRYRRSRPAEVTDEGLSGYTEPGGSEWTVKLPPNGDETALARTEVNWPATGQQDEGGAPAPPVEVVRLLAGAALGEPFFAVARLSSTRRRTEVVVGSRRAAEVDDDTVEGTVFAPGTSTVMAPMVTFREVEVELEEGSPEGLLRPVLDALVAGGARRSSRRSKLATVLQSAAQSGAAVEEVPALKASGAPRKPKKALTMADVLQEQARNCLDAITEHDPPVRLGDPDPEHLHKARVATRRLRSVLWALRRLQGPSAKPDGVSDQVSTFNLASKAGTLEANTGVPSPGAAGPEGGSAAHGTSEEGETVALTAHGWVAALRREMRWVGNALGAARDADVRLMALEAECARLGPLDQRGVEGVLSAARSEQAGAHERVLEVMGSDRYLAALRSLEALASKSEAVPAELWEHLSVPAPATMARLGGAQWRSVRRAVRRLGTNPSDEALHKLRIQAKRLRYISEAAAPVLRPAPNRRAATSMASATAGLQDVLGELHDAVVNEQWLRDLASRLSWRSRLVDEHAPKEQSNGVPTGSTEVALVAGQLIAAFRLTASSRRATWTHDWHRLAHKDLARWLSA